MNIADFSLDGMWALVTGASRGIGRETALNLGHYGANLILTGRRGPQRHSELENVVHQIRTMGRRAEVLFGDLSHVEDVRRVAEQALALQPRIDILVNVAGVVFPNTALRQTVKERDLTMAIHLRAPFLLSQAIAPSMIEQDGGSIIMVSSTAGIIGIPQRAAYAAAKGGLIMLTQQLAVEWGRHNIRVNCIAPTVTMTAMGEAAWADPEKRQAFLAKIPLAHFTDPVDTAGAVIYLASPAAKMINGTVLTIDGGLTVQ